ncbi:MAG: ubiquinol-cytochrome c reductase iron-sulfur subunit [Deinococcales bacterium]
MSRLSRREALVLLGAVGASGCMPVRDNPGSSIQSAGIKVGLIADFPSVGVFKNLDLAGNPAIVARVASAQKGGLSVGEVHLVALSTVCTHVGCGVGAPVKNELGCACHGSVFSLETGAVKQGPANKPLPMFKLEARGQEIFAVP